MTWPRCKHRADRQIVSGVGHVCCWLFFFGECALEVRRSCISPSAQTPPVAHRFSMRRLTRLPIIFLKTHTKITERHPPKLDRGTLARASSAAALALTPKTGRFLKKTMAKQVTLFVQKGFAGVHYCFRKFSYWNLYSYFAANYICA